MTSELTESSFFSFFVPSKIPEWVLYRFLFEVVIQTFNFFLIGSRVNTKTKNKIILGMGSISKIKKIQYPKMKYIENRIPKYNLFFI